MAAKLPTLDVESGGGSLGAATALLWELSRILRTECPWDQEQTFMTIIPHTLEEVWEVIGAVQDLESDQKPDLSELEDELGDLLFQVFFLAILSNEIDEHVDLESITKKLFAKLVRRHPHIFGNAKALLDAESVKKQWDQIKRTSEQRSLFSGIKRGMPGLLRAVKIQQKAASVGFDYGDTIAALQELESEVQELRCALEAKDRRELEHEDAVTKEIGDVIFSAVNIARLSNIDPELALATTSDSFQNRIIVAQTLANNEGLVFEELDLDEQERYYQLAKQILSDEVN